MPIIYKIDKAAALIRTNCVGNVGLADIRDHFTKLANDPDRPERLDVFLDLREITSSPTAKEMREASNTIGRLPPYVRFGACAIVAQGDVLYGMSRMFSVFAEPYFTVISAFRSAGEAEAWLTEQRALAASDSASPKSKGAS